MLSAAAGSPEKHRTGSLTYNNEYMEPCFFARFLAVKGVGVL